MAISTLPRGSQQHAHSVSLGPHFSSSETWNRANHWITEPKAKCRSCMWICLIGGKGKCAYCFLKKLRIAVLWQTLQNRALWEIKREIWGTVRPIQLPLQMESVKMSWPSSPRLPLKACGEEEIIHVETLQKSKKRTVHTKTRVTFCCLYWKPNWVKRHVDG